MKRYRRSFFVLIIILTLCFNTVIAANADSPHSFNSEQRKEIKEAIQEFLNSTKNLDFLPVQSFDADQAFPIDYSNEYIIETVKKKGSFFALKGENEQVHVPTSNGEIRLQIKDGKVRVLGYSVAADGIAKGFSWNKLETALQNAGLSGDPERVRIVGSSLYLAVFACIQLDGKEYVAVFNSMMDEADIENEKLYPAEELIAKMDAYYDEEATKKAARIAWLNGEGVGGGGVLARDTPIPQINFQRLSLIGGAAALCLILFLVFRKRQKRQRCTEKAE